jgi:hypothetical protein
VSRSFLSGFRRFRREQLLVQLRPTQIEVGARAVACDAEFGAELWHGALQALKGVDFGAAAVSVVLSNHFVRYALVPWSEALSTPQEEEAYVRHHFTRIHGERARGWALRWSDGLCSAVDQALLQELSSAFSGKPARLVSVQPALMAAFNRARRRIPAAGAWLTHQESGRACVALYQRGWRSVLNARGAAAELLERERHRAGGAAPEMALELA